MRNRSATERPSEVKFIPVRVPCSCLLRDTATRVITVTPLAQHNEPGLHWVTLSSPPSYRRCSVGTKRLRESAKVAELERDTSGQVE